MATIGNIVIGLQVNTLNFQKSLAKATSQLKAFGRSGAADVAAGAAKIQSAFSRLVMATQLKELRTGLSAATAGAGQLVKGLAKVSLAGLGTGIGKVASNLTALGKGLGGLGAVAALGGITLGAEAAVRQAASLEDALVGLSKAADLEGDSLGAMKSQLFGLATELRGIKLEDVFSIATSGAKQGIGADQLVEYTRGVAKLTTAMDDIPAEEIADSVGKINVVFKLGVGGAMQLGSAIDKLADSGVSSASGIMDVTQRVSGVAAAMHLGADETVALAAALLDTGTQAELGASALNRLLMSVVQVENHAAFAKTIGMEVTKFSALVKTKPIEAIQLFLGALQKLDSNAQLDKLGSIGFEGVQAKAEIQKLAQQTDSLAKYLGLASHEFKTLEQINISYNKTAETTNSQFTQFANNLKITLSHLGNGLLLALSPVFTKLNQVLSDFNAIVDYFSPGSGAKIAVTPQVEVKQAAKAKALTAVARQELEPPAEVEVADKAKDLGKHLAELERDLKTQVATFGKSSTEVDLYKLSLEGATAAQLKSTRALASQMSVLERNKALMERGKEVMEENLNPFEQYINKIKELDKLLKSQAITLGTYQRARQQAFEQTDVGAYEKELKTQIATVHMTSDEVKRYELSLAGASQQQLDSLSGLAALRTGLDQAKSIFEETRTPLEQYFTKLAQLGTLADNGLVTPDTLARGKRLASRDLGIDQRRLAGAAEFGSAEAASTILQYQGVDSPGQVKEAMRYAKEQTELLRKLLEVQTAGAGKGGLKIDEVQVLPF